MKANRRKLFEKSHDVEELTYGERFIVAFFTVFVPAMLGAILGYLFVKYF